MPVFGSAAKALKSFLTVVSFLFHYWNSCNSSFKQKIWTHFFQSFILVATLDFWRVGLVCNHPLNQGPLQLVTSHGIDVRLMQRPCALSLPTLERGLAAKHPKPCFQPAFFAGPKRADLYTQKRGRLSVTVRMILGFAFWLITIKKPGVVRGAGRASQ